MNLRSGARRGAGVLAVALAAGVLTSAAAADQAQAAPAPVATQPAATSPASSPAASPGATVATNLAATVKAVAVVPTDFASGYTLVRIPGGDSTAGQITMEFCGFRFTAEAHRVARHQVLLLDSAGRSTRLTNEVVAYDTVAQATKALAEWNRRSPPAAGVSMSPARFRATCRSGWTRPPPGCWQAADLDIRADQRLRRREDHRRPPGEAPRQPALTRLIRR